MECSGEPYHVKGEDFSPVIRPIPKSDGQIDLLEWYGLFARYDAMERRSDGAEVCPVDTHLVECFGVHDVEAVAPIHQYLGEALHTNDRVDHERISPWLRDALWVVGPVEGYSGF